MPSSLASVLSQPIIMSLASPRLFERGVVYAAEGHVGPLRASSTRVAAKVRGTESYAVELSAEAGRLHFACSCPVGRDAAFCKHCVAVALRWLRDQGGATPTLDDARSYLRTLPTDSLVELLIDHAGDDDTLARKLLLMTSRPASGASTDLASLRALIDQAFACHGFVHHRDVWHYIRGIDETIDVLDGMLAEGRASDIVELTEYALAAAERALEHIDDSDGQMGGVIERLEALHLAACNRAPPDPVVLAERLFRRELEGDWDVFDRAVVRYASVLGDAGIARYRELADERWAAVPQLAPGEGSRARHDGGRFRITRIMEALAETFGSLADQIAIRERDLSIGYRFLLIAELCRSHGEDDAALEWGERGIAAFPDDPDPRLGAFLIDEYRRRGRSSDALGHSLAAFDARPTLETYRELETDAQALGQWPERREAALTLLRKQDPESTAISRHPSLRGRKNSELVRVFLWEDDPDAAWEAANEGGCTPDLWLELAERRRGEHPEDALIVYRRHVDAVIAHKDKRAYKEAVELIDGTVRTLFAECGRPEDFDSYVVEVRTNHRLKRNLMKLIDQLEPAGTA